MAERRSPAALAFLAMAFLIVGLAGVFAAIAAPMPMHRALLRDAALDAALDAASRPDPQAALQALAPRLGESLEALAGADAASLPARIHTERAAMRGRFLSEAEALGSRLRLLVIVVTLCATAFGMAMASARGSR